MVFQAFVPNKQILSYDFVQQESAVNRPKIHVLLKNALRLPNRAGTASFSL